jgi:hypothetical protein
MLVNLGNQDEMSMQTNNMSSQRANNNNMDDLDDSGEYDQEERGA